MLWLVAIHEKKEITLLESTNMLKDMEESIIVYESYVGKLTLCLWVVYISM
jgi:hypothetical protein